MSFVYFDTADGSVVHWACDVYCCRAFDDVPNNGDRLPSLLPPGWSVVTVTSMTDGDYCYIQCPTHTTDLHRRYGDGTDLFENMKARG